MRTEYVFTVDGAELVYLRQIYTVNYYDGNHLDEYGVQQLCSVLVEEGDTAKRTFFNHFGDDSSWPPGWWDRMGRPQFTRKSWTRENYATPPQSWQEYFEVSCPNRLKGVKL